MKVKSIILTISSAAIITASAQNSVRMPDPFDRLNRAEKARLQTQASNMFNAAAPAVAEASASTVSIYTRGKRIAFGTAVLDKTAEPRVLTKWSEVASTQSGLTILARDGKTYPAQVAGVYPEHDLALIKTNAPLKPLDLKKQSQPGLGNFIALARPDGKVEGLGVVSVLARSLREKDKAYLGVMMDFSKAGKDGVPLQRVMQDSAADKAGLRNGDVIVSVADQNITGAMQMRNILQRLEPGSEISVTFRRGEAERKTSVKLGSRADNAEIQRVPRARMERMQRMGAVPSKVRKDFPSVIQSDMAIDPNDAGAPVTDLDGNIVGIAIARGSRIKTFITPTDTLQKVLAFDPTPVKQALASRLPGSPNARNGVPPRGVSPRRDTPADADPTDAVRRLLGEIEKNNQANEDLLREVERQLRDIERNQR